MGLTPWKVPKFICEKWLNKWIVTGLKMGPKHKGFPMTQSIHFDSREKKVLGLTPIRGPSVYCLKMFVKNKFNQTNKNIYTYEMGLIHWGRPSVKKEKGMGLTPWWRPMIKFDLGFWKIFEKETLILYYFKE